MEIKQHHFSTETWRQLLKAAPPAIVHEQFCYNTAEGFAQAVGHDIVNLWNEYLLDELTPTTDRIEEILIEKANEPKVVDA